MRSYSHLLYRVEDSVVNNKAIQTYSAWWPESQHVTEPGSLGQGQLSAGLDRGATSSWWGREGRGVGAAVLCQLSFRYEMIIWRFHHRKSSPGSFFVSDFFFSGPSLNLLHLFLPKWVSEWLPTVHFQNNPREHVRLEISGYDDVMPANFSEVSPGESLKKKRKKGRKKITEQPNRFSFSVLNTVAISPSASWSQVWEEENLCFDV